MIVVNISILSIPPIIGSSVPPIRFWGRSTDPTDRPAMMHQICRLSFAFILGRLAILDYYLGSEILLVLSFIISHAPSDRPADQSTIATIGPVVQLSTIPDQTAGRLSRFTYDL
jgi:hypothetical protein